MKKGFLIPVERSGNKPRPSLMGLDPCPRSMGQKGGVVRAFLRWTDQLPSVRDL